MNAMLSDRCANDLSKERFRDETRFGMMSRGRGERATVAANQMFAFAFVKSSGASEISQNTEGRFYPLLARLAFDFEQMVVRQPFSHFPHGRPQFPRTQLLRKNSEQEIEQRTVGLGKNLFRLGGESIGRMWFSKTGLGSGLMNQSVAFQTQQVSPDGIVG